MKRCPDCGRTFNWLQSLTGEYREHLRVCSERHDRRQGHDTFQVANCRGCPAGCFEGVDYADDKGRSGPRDDTRG